MYNLGRDFKTQMILACDDDGNFQEYIPRAVGHTGEGRRHLAITVLLYNNRGQVLLQKRKHKVFDNIWDFTGSTHPVHKEDVDETIYDAAIRCLKDEYGIENVDLKNLGFFNYFEKYENYCEHEYCAMMVGEYNDDFTLNPDAGYGYKWMDKNGFLEDVKKHPKRYAPWVVAGVEVLKKNDF